MLPCLVSRADRAGAEGWRITNDAPSEDQTEQPAGTFLSDRQLCKPYMGRGGGGRLGRQELYISVPTNIKLSDINIFSQRYIFIIFKNRM